MTPNFKELKRTMKLRYLPNVSRFNVFTAGILPEALVYGIFKKQRKFEIVPFRRTTRMNKYLTRQYSRLHSLAVKGNFKGFEKLALKLVRSSSIFRLCILHHANGRWIMRKERSLTRLWNQIRKLGKMENSKLQYSRWWIDKPNQKWARPLGAPVLHWKVLLLMWVQILEIFYQSRGMLSEWQHAGRSKKGLVTAWTKLTEIFKHYQFIYEFDLKGFFDRTSNQDVITELPIVNEWFNKVNNSKPTKYHLPPVEEDEAVKANEAHKAELKAHWIDVEENWTPVYETPKVENSFPEEKDWGAPVLFLDPMDIDYEEQKALYFPDDAHQEENAKRYAEFLKHIEPQFLNYLPFSEKSRELGRDEWKGLGKKDKGFPQGANSSPFLTTLVIDKIVGENLKGNLLMYMDDGLIYGKTLQEMEASLTLFKERLATVGLELESSKSRLVRDDRGWKGPLKFLGIQVDEKGRYSSKTRSGTEKLFVEPLPIETVRRLLDVEHPQISEQRVRKWLFKDCKDFRKGVEWAVDKGFFSNLVAMAFNPSKNRYEFMPGLASSVGIAKAKLTLAESNGLASYIIGILNKRSPLSEQTINNLSSYSVLKFMKRLRRKGNKR